MELLSQDFLVHVRDHTGLELEEACVAEVVLESGPNTLVRLVLMKKRSLSNIALMGTA
jgi:hypothetical protein